MKGHLEEVLAIEAVRSLQRSECASRESFIRARSVPLARLAVASSRSLVSRNRLRVGKRNRRHKALFCSGIASIAGLIASRPPVLIWIEATSERMRHRSALRPEALDRRHPEPAGLRAA